LASRQQFSVILIYGGIKLTVAGRQHPVAVWKSTVDRFENLPGAFVSTVRRDGNFNSLQFAFGDQLGGIQRDDEVGRGEC
jgi:hypothetical protein